MRKVVFLVVASLLLSPTISMAQQTAPPNALRFIIEPGEVAPGPTAQMITGSITVTRSSAGSSRRTGGGCLIYTSVRNHTPCTKDSQCQTGEGVGGYCANLNPGQAAPTVCWHQPVQASCHKSPTDPLPVDKAVPFDNPTTPYPSGVQRPIRWRVVSCQNLVDLGCNKGKTDQERKYRYGEKIKQFD